MPDADLADEMVLSTYAHVIRQDDDDRVRRLVDEHLGGEIQD